MNLQDLKSGTVKVRHPQRETPFMLSVVKLWGVTAVHGFEIGAKPPRQGKHLLLSDSVKNWIAELEPSTQPIE